MPSAFSGSPATPWFEVTTEEQAQLLSDSKALYHFAPFMGRAIGAAEAAQRAGVSTEGMMYWVKRFLTAGLLSFVEERRRSPGRPVKLYAAPSAIKIPFRLTPFEDLSTQLAEVYRFYDELRVRATARIRFRAGDHYRLLYRDDEKGTLNSENEFADAGTETRIEHNLLGVLWLPEEVARQVQAQCEALLALFEQYSRPGDKTEPYLFMNSFVALDPVQDARWLRDFTLEEERETENE